MKYLDEDEVRKLYENVDEIWPENDLWHRYSKDNIVRYIQNQSYGIDAYILNAGSGGSTYGLTHSMHHVDIAKNLIDCFPEHTVSNIESTPFDSESFSDVICVGSVLNYCDAMAALSELSRILKTGGSMILEFESSWGFEHVKDKGYKDSVALVEVHYSGGMTKQWVYSPKYIEEILRQSSFRIVDTYRFHYLSALHYSKHKNENAATRYTKLDTICRKIPVLKFRSNNVIYKCIKL